MQEQFLRNYVLPQSRFWGFEPGQLRTGLRLRRQRQPSAGKRSLGQGPSRSSANPRGVEMAWVFGLGNTSFRVTVERIRFGQ